MNRSFWTHHAGAGGRVRQRRTPQVVWRGGRDLRQWRSLRQRHGLPRLPSHARIDTLAGAQRVREP